MSREKGHDEWFTTMLVVPLIPRQVKKRLAFPVFRELSITKTMMHTRGLYCHAKQVGRKHVVFYDIEEIGKWSMPCRQPFKVLRLLI